jgi:hypothetical protein
MEGGGIFGKIYTLFILVGGFNNLEKSKSVGKD